MRELGDFCKMNESLLQPEEHVLSTLERDGSRRWLKPRLSTGSWLSRRRVLAYLLILLFTAIPFLKVGGKPLLLLDVPARRFIIFGYTFLPNDMLLLAILLVGVLLTIFLATAMFGRVWCGWACPQTVYMEFLFRPIERLFDGTTGRGGPAKKQRPAFIAWLKYPVYLVASFYLANTFLAYFVGTERLWQWVHQSPFQHPVPFLIVAFVTGAMLVDFCYFREQVCILMCPYGRFQSVLLDPSSLIVSYDAQRGEPRGKVQKRTLQALPIVSQTQPNVETSTEVAPTRGDCVDCGLCVVTCPTGIDIRKGLQMECINCTQCIDACNAVMNKLSRPPNLIRYSNQRRDSGERVSLLRPRLFIYMTLLAGLAATLAYLLITKKPFDAVVIRERGAPFTLANAGLTVRNLAQLNLTNRTEHALTLRLETPNQPDVTVQLVEADLSLEAQEKQVFHVEFLADRQAFHDGILDIVLRISVDDSVYRDLEFRLIGPRQ